MKQLLIALVAAIASFGMPTEANAVFTKFLIDDFSDPATPTHTSLPVVSRAVMPPAGIGGSIVPLSSGTDIAADRGLYGRAPMTTGIFDPGAIVAGSGDIDWALGPGEFGQIDWDVGGFDFDTAIATNIVLAGLTNVGLMPATIGVALFQDGVLADVTMLTLAPLASRDVMLTALAGPTTFIGLEIFELTGTAPAFLVASSVVANPEPATMALIGIGILGGAAGYRRRRKVEEDILPASTA